MPLVNLTEPVDGRETESMVLAQDTPYWHFYKAWKRCEWRVTVCLEELVGELG